MKNYSDILNQTPQSRPIPGRTDMVKNNAGGYVFQASDLDIVKRFILLGSENGTYYVSEQELTEQNANTIIKTIKANADAVCDVLFDIILNNKAPKADPSLFTLALVATYGDASAKKRVYDNLNNLIKHSTNLFIFLSNVQNLRGWSAGLRKAVARFYENRSEDTLAYQLVKYRNRAGFTHRDVLRLCHAKAGTTTRNDLFKFAVGKLDAKEATNLLVKTFGLAQSAEVKELVAMIKDNPNMTWEMVPTEKLNEPEVLKALVVNMPLTALIRNLNRFSKVGLTDAMSQTTSVIIDKLTNEENVVKSKIHPINVVNYLATYSKGRGVKGDSTWNPNQRIVDALCKTYELSLKNVEVTGKNILYAVDISGSMSSAVSGMALTASQISNVLACTALKSDPKAHLVWFDTQCHTARLSARNSIDEIIKNSPNGGGTDCTQPLQLILQYAKTNPEYVKFDAIVILTDNETWAGQTHSLPLVKAYRKFVPDFKVVEVAMVSNPYTQLPTDDKGVLRVVGFDSSVINVINNFIKE